MAKRTRAESIVTAMLAIVPQASASQHHSAHSTVSMPSFFLPPSRSSPFETAPLGASAFADSDHRHLTDAPSPPPMKCSDTCTFEAGGNVYPATADTWCDDEGEQALCEWGTDCTDCGPRFYYPPTPPPPSPPPPSPPPSPPPYLPPPAPPPSSLEHRRRRRWWLAAPARRRQLRGSTLPYLGKDSR